VSFGAARDGGGGAGVGIRFGAAGEASKAGTDETPFWYA